MAHREPREIVDGRNRLTYHIIVALLSLVLTALFWRSGMTLNQATAAAAFVLLFLVMIIGPMMRLWWKPYLRKLPYGIPFRWRGELGVWFIVLSILHGLLVWRGREWEVLPMRPGDLMGLIAIAWGLALAATSSGKAMKFLGIKQWKWLQMAGAYVIFYLVVAHTLYHAWLRPPFAPDALSYTYLAMTLVVITLQFGTFAHTVIEAKKLRVRASAHTVTLLAVVGVLAAVGIAAMIAPDPRERVERAHEWIPENLVIDLDVQTTYNGEEIFFRFNWDQPNPGGWYHDMIVYQDGEWRRFSDPDPWMVEGRSGFYEDRLSFKFDDGSVKGFANFAGWLTQHAGMRTMPGEAAREAIEAHTWLGEELGRSDIRKYLPQSREGEWWEGPWDKILPPEELEQLKADGVFLDLVMWRAHRSNAVEFGTDHWILEYRHVDEGTNAYGSQDWDPVEGPEYMFDPEVVSGGALDVNKIYEDPNYYRQDLFYSEREEWLGNEEPYFLHEDFMVPFDPEVAQWEGAAIPRRPIRAAEGSVGAWRARGIWNDGEWIVTMSRKLDTGYDDDKQFEPGGVYDWSPAVHHGSGERWHWVAYPYKLGLGLTAEEAGIEPIRYVEAVPFEGGEPTWEEVPVKRIPLIYPGLIDWTWLASERHFGYELAREDSMSMWDWHNDNPEELAELFLMIR